MHDTDALSADYFAALERHDPSSSAVVYGLCYIDPALSGLPPRFTRDFIHFDMVVRDKQKSALSLTFSGEAWGGSILSGSLDQAFAPAMRHAIDDLGALLNARASFRKIGHHTYIAEPSGRPKASLLAGRLSKVQDIVARMAEIARATNPS